jgi:methyl-accepting chemotaxis protein
VIGIVQNANAAMAKSMLQVNAISGAISDAIHQQNFVARKIAETVDGAAARTEEVSDSIAGVCELVQRSGRGADQMLAAAAELSRQAACSAATPAPSRAACAQLSIGATISGLRFASLPHAL